MKASVNIYDTLSFLSPHDGKPVRLLVLVDGGPLSVARVWDYRTGEAVDGLYWIYLRRHGEHFGPFFAEIPLAERAMRKILGEFGAAFFEQPVSWLRRQTAFQKWVEQHVGKSEDLVGAEWRREERSGGKPT